MWLPLFYVIVCSGAIPNNPIINCQDTPCRYEQLVCPEQDNCTVHCNDSRSYACFQTGVVCPSGRGDCTVNCDDSYACLQANMTCRQGDCTVNCENDFSCLTSAMVCSGNNCFLNCKQQESCTDATVQCLKGSCLVKCAYADSCRRLALRCAGGNCTVNCIDSRNPCCEVTVMCSSNEPCTVNCHSYSACQQSMFTCPGGGNCVFNFDGQADGHYISENTIITCQENSTCDIYCAGLQDGAEYLCRSSQITCPSYNGTCAIQCSGYYSCEWSTITLLANLNCTGRYSCVRSNYHLLCQ